MKATLQDLAAHLRWADAVAFAALAKCPAAQADHDILERLHHSAWVAGAFARILRGEPGEMPPKELPPFETLAQLTRAAGEALQAWIDGASEADLEGTVHIPWFPDPPLHLALKDAFLQAILHTQHHRGQTMTCLKQVGGEAKNVDYIIWIWKGKPAPR